MTASVRALCARYHDTASRRHAAAAKKHPQDPAPEIAGYGDSHGAASRGDLARVQNSLCERGIGRHAPLRDVVPKCVAPALHQETRKQDTKTLLGEGGGTPPHSRPAHLPRQLAGRRSVHEQDDPPWPKMPFSVVACTILANSWASWGTGDRTGPGSRTSASHAPQFLERITVPASGVFAATSAGSCAVSRPFGASSCASALRRSWSTFHPPGPHQSRRGRLPHHSAKHCLRHDHDGRRVRARARAWSGWSTTRW